MLSAAEQTFAIPELLERILLFAYEHGLHIVDKIHAKELFTLQRVSRNFKSVINGSTRLKFKMGIGFPLPGDRELARSVALVSPFLGHVEMDVYPFTFDKIEEEPELGGGHTDVLSIYLHIRADKFRHAVYENVGLLSGNRETYRGRHHSWRHMKMSPVGATVNVDVSLEFDNGLDGEDRKSVLSTYIESIYDDKGNVTFGEFADMLDAISQRTLNEHRTIQAFMSHKDFNDFIFHQVAKSFLQSAWMHLAWMQFEDGSAMKCLKRTLDLKPFFYQRPATARLDESLEYANIRRLRDLYYSVEDTFLDLSSDAGCEISLVSGEVQEMEHEHDLARIGATARSGFHIITRMVSAAEDGALRNVTLDRTPHEHDEDDAQVVNAWESNSSISWETIDSMEEVDESSIGGVDKTHTPLQEENEPTFSSSVDLNKLWSGERSKGLEEGEVFYECTETIEQYGDTFYDCINTIKQDEETKAIHQDNSNQPSTPEEGSEEMGNFWTVNLSKNAQAGYTKVDTAELYIPDAFDVLLVLLILLTLWALYTMISLLFALGWRR